MFHLRGVLIRNVFGAKLMRRIREGFLLRFKTNSYLNGMNHCKITSHKVSFIPFES